MNSRSIKVGNVRSNLSEIDLGILQGSSISGTLFFAIDSISQNISNSIGKNLFVDDLRLSITAFDLHTDENKRQRTLDI